MLHPIAIGPERRTIDGVIDHLEHAVAVMGADRVCLGGDFTKRLWEAMPPPPEPKDGLMPPGLTPGLGIEGAHRLRPVPGSRRGARAPRLERRGDRGRHERQPPPLPARVAPLAHAEQDRRVRALVGGRRTAPARPNEQPRRRLLRMHPVTTSSRAGSGGLPGRARPGRPRPSRRGAGGTSPRRRSSRRRLPPPRS